MKGQSDNMPPSIQDLKSGFYYVNMDIHEETHEGVVSYTFDYVKISGYPTYGATVEALIRERYTESDEFAIQRQRYVKPEQFTEYDDFCEACKVKAKPVFFPEQ